jgi:hypothetical protein
VNAREELVAAYLRLHPENAARLLESLSFDETNVVLNAGGLNHDRNARTLYHRRGHRGRRQKQQH